MKRGRNAVCQYHVYRWAGVVIVSLACFGSVSTVAAQPRAPIVPPPVVQNPTQEPNGGVQNPAVNPLPPSTGPSATGENPNAQLMPAIPGPQSQTSPLVPNVSDLPGPSPVAQSNIDSDFTGIDTSNLLSGSFGATAGSLSAAPNLIGDFFGGGVSVVRVGQTTTIGFHVTGNIVSGGLGAPNAVYSFNNNDFMTVGMGSDASGDNNADTFPVSQPQSLNPNATFINGTAVFTDSTATQTASNGPPRTGDTWFAEFNFGQQMTVFVPAGGAASVRRVKIAENNSPIPRDRIIFDYSFFNDVVGNLGDVRRYTFGFEKTYCNQLMSVDVRMPFASTLDSRQVIGTNSGSNTELGNLSIVLKAILWGKSDWVVTGGLGIGAPTADDTVVAFSDGSRAFNINNDAVHLQPYVAALYAPQGNFFTQAFVQWDVDVNGNPVFEGTNPAAIGTLQDASLMFVDVSMGYWVYRRRSTCGLTGVAPVAELHYSTTIQDGDRVSTSTIDIAPLTNRFDVLNLTLGTHFSFGNGLVISPAIAIPLRNGHDEQFDYEAAVRANLYF